MHGNGNRAAGFTLLEMAIAVAVMGSIYICLARVISDESGVVGHVENYHYTAERAQSALWRVRRELATAVQSPSGVTNAMAPVYGIVAPDTGASGLAPFCSITWRPVIGFPTASDPTYASYYATPASWTGCLSGNGVLYSNTAKVLQVVSFTTARGVVSALVLDTVSGSTGATRLRREVLAGDPVVAETNGAQASTYETVTEFRIYNAESTNDMAWSSTGSPAFAPGATNTTYLVGFYLRVEHRSVSPLDYSRIKYSSTGGRRNITSNPDNSTSGAEDMRIAVSIPPETLTVTSGKPFVGP